MLARVLGLCALIAGCDQVFSLDRPDPPDAAPDAPLPVESWLQVDGGTRHSCGIRRDHTLWCWGRNDVGQLGLGTAQADRERSEPAQVGADADWETISVGTDTSCAIKTDRSLWCWGINEHGQIGDGTTMHRNVPVRVAGAFVAVTNGWEHTCAIDEAMALSCWGSSQHGRLGTGSANTPVPLPVTGGGTWQLVRAGERSTCGLQTDGSLWCWGSNAAGRLGIGDNSISMEPAPTRVGSELWKALSLDSATACAIRDVGLMRCWGINARGQIGDRTNSPRNAPTPVETDAITDWTAVATGAEHTCGIHGAGELACWGLNTHGQSVTDLSRESRSTPAGVLGGDAPWATLGLGDRHTCAIDTQGQLWCAGHAANGALGTAGGGSVRAPVMVGSWSTPAAGEDATCALDASSQLACWGSNRAGLLGDGLTRARMAPSPPMPRVYTSVDLGGHGCAIGMANDRWCWGTNNQGQYGNTTTTSSTTAVMILPAYWRKVSAAREHTCGITVGNVLQCWGRNDDRQTGSPATGNVTTPYAHEQFWKDIGTGTSFSCGLRTAGSAWCWGDARDGQLGHGSTSGTTNMPQEVMSMLAFDAIASGGRHSCAIAGTAAWCWGWNADGQLGDATSLSRAVPVQVLGAWQMIALGERHSCGIRSDGGLACWGGNQYGQLGNGTLINEVEPVQVGTELDWNHVTAGNRHSCATKHDGTLWCWGANEEGAVGNDAAWRPTLELVTR